MEKYTGFGLGYFHLQTDLPVRQAFDAAKPKNLGLLVRQFSHPLADVVHQLCRGRTLDRTFGLSGRLRNVFKRHRATALANPLAKPIDRPARGKTREHGTPILNVLSFGQMQSRQESVLVAIQRIFVVVEQPIHRLPNPRPVLG